MSMVISENKLILKQYASIIKPGIELIGLINGKGRMVDSIGKGVIDLPKQKRDMFFMKIALRNSMQKDFDEDLGDVNYCVTQRGSTKYISIPCRGENTILVVTKKDVDQDQVVTGINQIIQYSEQFLGEKISREQTAQVEHL